MHAHGCVAGTPKTEDVCLLGEDLLGAGTQPERKNAMASQEPRADEGVAEKSAARDPVARVMVEVPTILFDAPFDYRVPAALDEDVLPGVRVNVRLGSSCVRGVVWERTAKTADGRTLDSLRPIESVVSPAVWVPDGLRRDLEGIAAATGGTVSQLLRLALPDDRPSLRTRPGWDRLIGRVDDAEGDRASAPNPTVDTRFLAEETSLMRQDYAGPTLDDEAMMDAETVWDVLPGPQRWARDTAWLVARALAGGRHALVELPDSRHITVLLDHLARYGLCRFELPTKKEVADGRPDLSGDIAVIDSDDTPTSRTLGFLAAAGAAARVVIGTRAVMYAPMPDQSLYIAVDDDAYQNWDGFMPYAGVRGVLRLRARLGDGGYVALSQTRSAFSQQSVETGTAGLISGRNEALHRLLPTMDWLSSDRLAHLADPALGSRLPHRAVQALRDGLEKGPVLVVPGSTRSFCLFVCAGCGWQARCARCTGPLASVGLSRPPVCAWCGHSAEGWECPHCGSDRLRIGRFGMGGTLDQLRSLLPGADFIVREKIDPATAPHGTKRFVPQIPDEPCVVVAVPQSVPQVVHEDGTPGGYRTVVLLDAWTAGYAQRLDGRSDMLASWMMCAGQALPASQGGTALLVGDCPEPMGRAWQAWRPEVLLHDMLVSRRTAGLPPTVAAASVWGRRVLVRELLSRIGALDGDLSTIEVPIPARSTTDDGGAVEGRTDAAAGVRASADAGAMSSGRMTIPSVLGPLDIRPQETQRRSPTFHGAGDRVRAVVRVPLERSGELAYRLRVVAANIEREGRKGELRYWIDPKDLRER